MREVFERIRLASQAQSTVLILGESGTGKELVAGAIHQNSPRKNAPFVAVNIAAVPETLLESELFGHVKGAFTGAIAGRVGKIESAHGGTLFIDEIGDLQLECQAKLLRALEYQRIAPVGSNEEKTIDARIVAATSRDLRRLIRNSTFREDLYYRLDVIAINLPPLRERREDIPVLVEHFLAELSRSLNRPAPRLDRELTDFLLQCDWPGNVRQLRNCLESMVVLAESDVLSVDDLPESVWHGNLTKSPFELPDGFSLRELEKMAIEQALHRHRRNRRRAASALGISVRTLQRKLKNWSGRRQASGRGANGALAKESA